MRRSALVVSALLVMAWRVVAAREAVVILYPQVPEPERAVFTLMREGALAEIERQSLPALSYAVDADLKPALWRQRLRDAGPRGVIVLGRRAWQLTHNLDLDLPVVVGGVELPVPYNGTSGISLIPDPKRVFATLRQIAPGIRTVEVVIDAQEQAWLIEAARAAAAAHGLQLVCREVTSVAQAAAEYLHIVRHGNPNTDALWLLENRRFITSDTLPTLIEVSWARDFLVFSNVLDHVNKGVLFALYPDPRALGRSLAMRALRAPAAPEVDFLQDVHRAGNARVAAHLSKVVNSAQLAHFELVLGKR